MNLCELPSEIIVHVTTFLRGRDVLDVAASCTSLRAVLAHGGRLVPWPRLHLTSIDDATLDALANLGRPVTSLTLAWLRRVSASQLAALDRLLPDVTDVIIRDTRLPADYVADRPNTRLRKLDATRVTWLAPYLDAHPQLDTISLTGSYSGEYRKDNSFVLPASTRHLVLDGQGVRLDWNSHDLLASLETLECRGDSTLGAATTYHMPALTRLVVWTHYFDVDFPRLDQLDAPNLATLVVGNDGNPTDWYRDPLVGGWGAALTSLTIPFFVHGRDAHDALRQAERYALPIQHSHPTLRRLTLSGPSQSYHLVDYLRYSMTLSRAEDANGDTRK
jgi:hypothetical protein